MMNWKNLLFTCLFTLLAVTSAQAQEDMTKYIKNPSFESGTDGWTLSDAKRQSNDVFTKKSGTYYVEKWVDSNQKAGNASARQKLTGLPMGKYKLTAAAQNLSQSNESKQCKGAYIIAGSQKTTVYGPNDYSVEFSYVSGTIEIGYVAEGAEGNWLAFDNFRLYKTGNVSVDEAKTALQPVIEEANGLFGDGSGNGAADLKTVIDAAQAVYDNASPEISAIEQAISQLNAAIDTYRELNVSEDMPLDKTKYITNPSFENGTTGWTIESLSSQGNSSFKKKDGTYYMEKWVGYNSAVGSASARQKLKNLPNGVYKLTVAAQNYSETATTKKNTGAYIYAGDQKETVYTPDDYSVKFTSVSGEMEIGFVAEDATGNWLAVDNFRLYLIGEADVTGEIQRLIAAAEGIEIPEEIATTYQLSQQFTDALAAAKALTETSTQAEIGVAYNALQEALVAEEPLIEHALFAYRVNNPTEGTGAAPKVTQTNSFVATGATEALMRATMTGSNIMERGVCWSTERNPTVLDERTTKSFTLNGTIFHVKGLKPSTVYYLRPYVMNKTYQVAYGDEVKIVTHPKGNCTWSWNEGAPDAAANERCRTAIKQTIDYFNEWTGIMGFHLSGNYGAGTPTADCSYGGWMRIGPSASYQAIGTVLHETGHGVGVGTHARYADTNLHNWTWLGRQANEVYHFLENDYTNASNTWVGDGMHAWGAQASFDWLVNGADKDKHQELQYIGGMCILYGMFIDGLDPTSSDYRVTQHNGISGYAYNFDEMKKYYLMNKNAESGLGKGLAFQRTSMIVAWKENFLDEAVSDSAAWYLEYDAKNCYYSFRNAATGRYLSHSNGIQTKSTTKPTTTEWFQLMPDRTDVTIGTGTKAKKTHGYWLTWTDSNGFKAMNARQMTGSLGYSPLTAVDFNFTNSATSQQWIIISEDELAEYRAAAGVTAIRDVQALANDQPATAVYDLQGRRVSKPSRGVYIVGGRKVLVK